METQPQLQPRSFPPADPRLKSPVLAMVMSAMPGLGQVYVGYVSQGFINVLTVGSVIAVMNTNRLGAFEPLFGIFLAFFWLYNIVDAGRRAVYVNEALMGMEGSLPPGFGAQDPKATLLVGLVLIFAGVLALLHILIGLSFEWVNRWWPLVLVLTGIYLIWRARNDMRNASAKVEGS